MLIKSKYIRLLWQIDVKLIRKGSQNVVYFQILVITLQNVGHTDTILETLLHALHDCQVMHHDVEALTTVEGELGWPGSKTPRLCFINDKK